MDALEARFVTLCNLIDRHTLPAIARQELLDCIAEGQAELLCARRAQHAAHVRTTTQHAILTQAVHEDLVSREAHEAQVYYRMSAHHQHQDAEHHAARVRASLDAVLVSGTAPPAG